MGGTIEEQIDGAFDEMEERLALVGLTLEHVVQMNCLFRNIWDIPHRFSTEKRPETLCFTVSGLFAPLRPALNRRPPDA